MRALVAAALLSVLSSYPARAFGVHAECKADVEKHCSGIEKPGKLMRCLHKNKATLAPECSAKMTAAKKKFKEMIQACREDKKKFCHGVKPRREEIQKCFKEHEAEISPSCKKELTELKVLHKEN